MIEKESYGNQTEICHGCGGCRKIGIVDWGGGCRGHSGGLLCIGVRNSLE